ncbi:MAG: hypothetical protein WBQ73_04270 [Candidatus Babeliales bacterium]
MKQNTLLGLAFLFFYPFSIHASINTPQDPPIPCSQIALISTALYGAAGCYYLYNKVDVSSTIFHLPPLNQWKDSDQRTYNERLSYFLTLPYHGTNHLLIKLYSTLKSCSAQTGLELLTLLDPSIPSHHAHQTSPSSNSEIYANHDFLNSIMTDEEDNTQPSTEPSWKNSCYQWCQATIRRDTADTIAHSLKKITVQKTIFCRNNKITFKLDQSCSDTGDTLSYWNVYYWHYIATLNKTRD